MEQTAVAAENLTELAGRLDRILDPATLDQRTAALQNAVLETRQNAESVIDFAFWRLLILIIVLPIAIVMAMLTWRWLAHRSVRPPAEHEGRVHVDPSA